MLDYGCGSGTFTIPSARIVGKRGRVYAFETRSRLLEQVREKAREAALSNIVTVLTDSSKPSLDFSDESVGIILVYEVMHEVEDQWGHISKSQYLEEYGELQKQLRQISPAEEKVKNLDQLAHFLSHVSDAWKVGTQEQLSRLLCNNCLVCVISTKRGLGEQLSSPLSK